MPNTARKHLPAVEPAAYAPIADAVRAEAVRLLEQGDVAAIVGYRAGRRAGTAQPAVVTTADEAAKLVFSPACVNNLALYLTKAKKGVLPKGKIGIVAKGCDLRALYGLLSEAQLKREEIVVLGVACPGVYRAGVSGDLPLSEETVASKCRECSVHVPEAADVVAGTLPSLPSFEAAESAEIARLDAMTPKERWAFWTEHFSRCIRCYACRQVCPFCYCEQCLCDRNRPQAVETSPRPASNTAWHIVRAMHLAGRCGGCAECERVCPMDIPLNLLNRKMAKELKDLYGHEAGFDVKEKGPLSEYKEDDDQGFIK